MTKKLTAWLTDTAERVASTFGETFVGVFGIKGIIALSGGDWHTVKSLGQAAAAAGGAAVLALVKGYAAKKRKGTISPASLVKTT